MALHSWTLVYKIQIVCPCLIANQGPSFLVYRWQSIGSLRQSLTHVPIPNPGKATANLAAQSPA